LYGPRDGVRVVWLGGTPSTRWMTAKGVARFEQAGIRAVVYDRPGYGGSTRQRGRQVVDTVEDVRLLVTPKAGTGSPRSAVPVAGRTRSPAPPGWPIA
jgi:hypothetical protein